MYDGENKKGTRQLNKSKEIVSTVAVDERVCVRRVLVYKRKYFVYG